MNNINYVKNNVTLESYSSSENFKGFCYSEIGWGNTKYINSLLRIINSLVGQLQIISSLNIGMNLKEHAKFYSMSKENVNCQDLLIEAGVITNILDETSGYDFHFNKNIDELLALNIIRYQTSIGAAFGHLFFVDKNRGVIIYPHDDCGLGFIFEKNTSQNKKLEFLEMTKEKYKHMMSFEM